MKYYKYEPPAFSNDIFTVVSPFIRITHVYLGSAQLKALIE